jgi:hypothetical protein
MADFEKAEPRRWTGEAVRVRYVPQTTRPSTAKVLTMREYSNHQKKVIARYYDNREQIDNQRLSELATELFLAEGKKRAKLWERAGELMLRLKVPESRVQHVVGTDDPAMLAEVVNDLQSGKIGK